MKINYSPSLVREPEIICHCFWCPTSSFNLGCLDHELIQVIVAAPSVPCLCVVFSSAESSSDWNSTNGLNCYLMELCAINLVL